MLTFLKPVSKRLQEALIFCSHRRKKRYKIPLKKRDSKNYPVDPQNYLLFNNNFFESFFALADNNFTVKLYLSLSVCHFLIVYGDTALLNKTARL